MRTHKRRPGNPPRRPSLGIPQLLRRRPVNADAQQRSPSANGRRGQKAFRNIGRPMEHTPWKKKLKRMQPPISRTCMETITSYHKKVLL